MNVPGNMNPVDFAVSFDVENLFENCIPWPIFDGMIKRMYAQCGNPLGIIESPAVPRQRKIVPHTNSHFNRLVQVIKNPVAVPAADAQIIGTRSRRPELVALSNKTAWK
jgi:hypothetical protein